MLALCQRQPQLIACNLDARTPDNRTGFGAVGQVENLVIQQAGYLAVIVRPVERIASRCQLYHGHAARLHRMQRGQFACCIRFDARIGVAMQQDGGGHRFTERQAGLIRVRLPQCARQRMIVRTLAGSIIIAGEHMQRQAGRGFR